MQKFVLTTSRIFKCKHRRSIKLAKIAKRSESSITDGDRIYSTILSAPSNSQLIREKSTRLCSATRNVETSNGAVAILRAHDSLRRILPRRLTKAIFTSLTQCINDSKLMPQWLVDTRARSRLYIKIAHARFTWNPYFRTKAAHSDRKLRYWLPNKAPSVSIITKAVGAITPWGVAATHLRVT
jgi:hypothetical protein